MAGDCLLFGSGLRGGECVGMRRIGFRKDAVDFLSPAAVVFHDLVGDFSHG